MEQAFREELDIHSPSRVMMSLGRFASVGVVKGLDSVDVKKYAEKQAGSLAAAYSGMGAVGGNVKQWLMAAMMKLHKDTIELALGINDDCTV